MALTFTPQPTTLAAADDSARSARYASSRPWIISGLALSAGTGLNVAISAGTAWIAGYYLEWDASSEQAVSAASTNYVYLTIQRDGNDNVTGVSFVINTTGTPPSDDHAVIGTAATDGSSVTGTATTGRSPSTQVEPTPTIPVDSVFTRTGAVVAAASDYDADQVDYDNSTSGLTATDVQEAVDELAARPVPNGWTGVDGTGSDLSKNNTTFETLLSFAAEANKTYIFEAYYMISNGNGGNKIQIIVPSGASVDFSIDANRSDASFNASTVTKLIDIAASSSQNLQGTAGTRQAVILTGIAVTTGTAGNIEIQVAQQSASATTVFKAGANVKWKDIT